MAWNLFGFQIERKTRDQVVNEQPRTFAIPQNDDGAVTIQSGAYYGTYVDLDGVIRNEIELITRYREMAMQPEIEGAIDDILNESVIHDDSGKTIEINYDDLKQPASIKKKIQEEFDYILKLYDFNNKGQEIYKRWYIDGRLFYHVIIDEQYPSKGIQELRYIDPRRIRKVREIQKTRDPKSGMEIIKNMQEYYIYNERGIIGGHTNLGTRIAVDSIININSGLMDSKKAMVLSYLNKAIKPLNNLRMMEDSTVIYRMSRAPERRIFYVDVGNMPTVKAEQYLSSIQTKYRNKLVYDASTGEIRDDRKHLSMLEDFWLPRREGSKGTEISTLPGGQNLGELEDVKYFEKKLYKSLGVPITRLEQQQGFTLGRVAEVTRDELKFTKFVEKLRRKFSTLFDETLRIQLVLKKICSDDEWETFKEDIWYDYLKDNNFNELKEAELMRDRVSVLQIVDPYVGRYFSQSWVKKKVLHFTEEEIKEMDEEIEEEQDEMAKKGVDAQGNPILDPVTGQPIAPPQGGNPALPAPPPGQSQQLALPPPAKPDTQKLQENPDVQDGFDAERSKRFKIQKEDLRPV
jgi:hypothetical protein